MKKLLSFLLAILTVCAFVPFSVSADEYDGQFPIVTCEENFIEAVVKGEFEGGIMFEIKEHITFTSDLTINAPRDCCAFDFLKGFTVNEGVTLTILGSEEDGNEPRIYTHGDVTVNGILTGQNCGSIRFFACDLRGSGTVEGDFNIIFEDVSRSLDYRNGVIFGITKLAVADGAQVGSGVEVCEISSLLTLGNGVSRYASLDLDYVDAEAFDFAPGITYSDVSIIAPTDSLTLNGSFTCEYLQVFEAYMETDTFPARVVTFGAGADITATRQIIINGSAVLEKGAKVTADYLNINPAYFYNDDYSVANILPNYWRVKSGASLCLTEGLYLDNDCSILVDGILEGSGTVSGGDLLIPGTVTLDLGDREPDRDVYTLDTPIGRYIMTNEGNGIHSYSFKEGEFPAGLDELLIGAANTGIQIGMPTGEPVQIEPPAGDVRFEFNADGDKISMNGTVLNAPPTGSGDANGDGSVNAKDVSAVLKVLSGWSGIDCDMSAADYNGDGKVNAKDVSAVMKFLAGWN